MSKSGKAKENAKGDKFKKSSATTSPKQIFSERETAAMASKLQGHGQLRVPPHSKEAEMALLGSIIIKPESHYQVSDFIHPGCFYFERHSRIYEAMTSLLTDGNPIDVLTLTNLLKERKYLDQVGGTSYLMELSQYVPSAASINYYGGIVRKNFVMRELIDYSDSLSTLCYDGSCELEEILEEAEKQVFAISNTGSTSRFEHIKNPAIKMLDHLLEMSERKGGVHGVPTGFPALDNMLSGLQPSDLVILAARPSVGKTSFALDIVRNAAVHNNIPVGFFSLEMSSDQLVYRMLSAEAKIDAWKIRSRPDTLNKTGDTNEFVLLQEASAKLSAAPIYIDDQPGNNILRMKSVARKLKMEKGLGLIVVDYLQLMMPTHNRNSDNVVQQVTEISRSLKNLARELHVPVLALSQLSRAVESRGGKPRLSDLRDSGSIEQDADVVMFIHREKDEEEGGRQKLTEILVEKHRNGPTGRVELMFSDKNTSFTSVTKKEYGSADGSLEEF